MLKLRPYQSEAIQAIQTKWSEGITRQLVTLPTGTGKTVIFANLIKELGCKTLVIAHTEELIQQAVNKIQMVASHHIGICKAEKNELDNPIVVASIQTIRQDHRLEELKQMNFSLIVIDEAHHAAADSYLKILQELGFMDNDPKKLFVGFTATPKRGDGVGLNKIFQEIVYKKSILKMIKSGYLADIKCQKIETNVDISSVGSSRGDFVVGQLANVINTSERNLLIVKSYAELTPNKKAIAFTANVNHALDLAETFTKSGIKAQAVHGNMEAEQRENAIQDFKNGNIQVLTNCMVLTEGFDEPTVESLLICRPTRSQGLFTQMVGRGTRIHPSKQFCTVLDFADSSSHKLCGVATLLGNEVQIKNNETLLEAVVRTEEEATSLVHSNGNLKIIEVDLLDQSKINWIATATGNYRAALGSNKYINLIKTTEETYWIKISERDVVIESLIPNPLPLEYAQGTAEDYIRESGSKLADKSAEWRKEKPTFKQIEILKKKKKYKEGMSRGQCSDIMQDVIAKQSENKNKPASKKQIDYLRRLGMCVPNDLSSGQARKMISSKVG